MALVTTDVYFVELGIKTARGGAFVFDQSASL